MAASTVSITANSAAYQLVAEDKGMVRLQNVGSHDVRVHVGSSLPDADSANFFMLKGELLLEGLAAGDNVYVRADSHNTGVSAITWNGGVADSQGTVSADGVTAVDQGSGGFHKTVFTLTDAPITLTDDAGNGQVGAIKLIDFPAGNIVIMGAVLDAELTLVGAEWTDTAAGDVGLGSAVVSGGGALSSTEQNVIPTTEIAPMVAQVGPITGQSTAATFLAAAGTTDADLYLNVRIDDNAAHITASGTITGTVTVLWANAGDIA
jgi:hypothetical protein